MPKINFPIPAASVPAAANPAVTPADQSGITPWDESKSTVEHVADWAKDSFREDPWGTAGNVALAAASFTPVGWAGRGVQAYRMGTAAYRAAEVGSVAGVGVKALDAAAAARTAASAAPAAKAATSTASKVVSRSATAGAVSAVAMAGAGYAVNEMAIDPQKEHVKEQMKDVEPRLEQARKDMETLRDRAANLNTPKYY